MDLSNGSIYAGSPLITPDVIFFYFLAFISITAIVYFTIHFIRRPENPNHFKGFFLVGLAVKILIIISALVIAAFYFLPAPKISSSYPNFDANNVSIPSRIEVQFDRPVSRFDLEKHITPEVQGVWKYEVGLHKTHLYRKLVFYPNVTFLPDTEYLIEFRNVKNVSKLSKSKNFSFKFRTESLPKVTNSEPDNEQKEIPIDSSINVNLDKPNKSLARFNFILEPNIPFDVKLSTDKSIYTVIPKEKFKQGTIYTLKITKNPISYNNKGQIVYQGNEIPEFKTSFTTKLPPQITSFSPTGDHVFIDSKIKITFSKPMQRNLLRNSNVLTITPSAEGKITWIDDSNLEYTPGKFNYDTNYTIKVSRGLISRDGSFFENDAALEFKTIGPVRLLSAISDSNNNSVGVNNSLRFNFDQELDHTSAESNFSIIPQAEGSFSWDSNTLIFMPNSPLQHDTQYTVTFSPGIKGTNGPASNQTFATNFTTESFILKLAVPSYLQKYTLSCETASLRMLLAFRGINTDEDSLLSDVGFDNTPHVANTWGNPNIAFVGNPKGRQMLSGYGVHWNPIEKVAKKYRNAQAFSGWALEKITRELLNGNPIQIWYYAGGGRPVNWLTPSGEKVFAVTGEHTAVVKGFIGKAENPSQLILNDPLIGEVYLSQADFTKKWDSFGRSGVVVF